MHRAIQKQGVASFLREEGPALAGAFLIAELFYKWGSFALECVGFLATWYCLSFLLSHASSLLGRNGNTPADTGG